MKRKTKPFYGDVVIGNIIPSHLAKQNGVGLTVQHLGVSTIISSICSQSFGLELRVSDILVMCSMTSAISLALENNICNKYVFISLIYKFNLKVVH